MSSTTLKSIAFRAGGGPSGRGGVDHPGNPRHSPCPIHVDASIPCLGWSRSFSSCSKMDFCHCSATSNCWKHGITSFYYNRIFAWERFIHSLIDWVVCWLTDRMCAWFDGCWLTVRKLSIGWVIDSWLVSRLIVVLLGFIGWLIVDCLVDWIIHSMPSPVQPQIQTDGNQYTVLWHISNCQ